MKRLAIAFLFLPVLILGQSIPIFPGLYAHPNPSAGDAAYRRCTAGGGSSFVCYPIKVNAIGAEAQNRVTSIFGAFLNWLTSEHLYYVTPSGACYGECFSSMDFGIDFRSTFVYVTDPATNNYSLGEAYPTTRGGFTFGWTSGPAGGMVDRDNTVDPRLAGINYTPPSTVSTFRLDLDAAGSKVIRLAIGDTVNQGAQDVEIFDNTTSLLHLTPASITAYKWWDATGVERTSSADWVSNNAGTTLTFSTTTLILKIGGHSAAGYTVLAHLHVTDGGGGGFAAVNRRTLGPRVGSRSVY